jgi:alkyl hydroperoxide reductase subunit AhpC
VRTVGDTFPTCDLEIVEGRDHARAVRLLPAATQRGEWRVWFFWPYDFSQVCPTEVVAFDRRAPDFADRGARVIGVSVDSVWAHLAWRQQHPPLRDLTIPLAADVKRTLVTALGVLDKRTGVAMRATFIVDPEGVIRWVGVYDTAVGRNVDEVVRVLDALQTGAPCPCGWEKGEPTLSDRVVD